MPLSASASVGFAEKSVKSGALIPACSSCGTTKRRRPACRIPLSVTSSGFDAPARFSSAGRSLIAPFPKTMRVGKLITELAMATSRGDTRSVFDVHQGGNRHMVRSLLVALALALLPLAARAEEERVAKNTVYLELGGNGLIYSVNYERFLSNDLNVRVGLEYFSLTASGSGGSGNATLAIFPVTVSFLGLSKGPHAFELGAGIDIAYASASTDSTGGSSFASGTSIA